jgi:Ca2+/Na+ antiporter
MDKNICIKGKFEGYYLAVDPKNIGGSDYFELGWKKVVVSDFKPIEQYSSEELKVGHFDYKPAMSDVDLITESNQLIKKETLYDVLLRDYKILASVKDGNTRMVKVEGVFYGRLLQKNKLEKKTEPEELYETSKIELTSNDTEIQGNNAISAGGCGNRHQVGSNSFIGRAREKFNNSWINSQNRKHVGTNGNGGCNKTSNNGGGCFINILRIIGLLFLIAGIQGLFNSGISDVQSWVQVGLGILMILASLFPRLRGVLGSLFGLIILLYIVGSFILNFAQNVDTDWWNTDDQEQRGQEEVDWDEERETKHVSDTISDDNGNKDLLHYYQHNHNWKENTGQKHSGKFKVRQDFYPNSKNNREQLNISTYNSSTYWHNVYGAIIRNDNGKLTEICKMFSDIGKQKNLNRNEFADMVVTSVQWIPYVLVLEKSCEESIYDGGFVSDYLAQGKPCLGGIKFGIQSPVEFMSNFKGDCDTRALLCFQILDYFKYDVAVLVSETYGHSVLGISSNVGGGDYVKYKGKRYYGWETTSIGFKAGHMAPDCSNMRYWSVALSN